MTFLFSFLRTLFFLSCVLILSAMGVWQLLRHDWKQGYIARAAASLEQPARPFSPVLDFFTYDRKLTFTGRFENKVIRLQGPLTGAGQTDYFLSPFRPNGATVTFLVNRGSGVSAPPVPEGQVTITGFLRDTGWRGLSWLKPVQTADMDRFVFVDPHVMAQKLGRTPAFAVRQIEMTSPEDPTGQLSRKTVNLDHIPDNHLHYAFTWFALALIAAVFGLALSFRRKEDA